MNVDPINRLISELATLPGIGERTALRLALHLLEQKKERVFSLAESLVDVAKNVRECEICCNLTALDDHCTICTKSLRDQSLVCVVSCVQDLMAIESSSSFQGCYHVLHGVLQPMSGIGPNNLRIDQLKQRVKGKSVNELILATPASIEGEATALFLKEMFESSSVKISRISSGVPVGGDLQFADRLSLARALSMRKELN